MTANREKRPEWGVDATTVILLCLCGCLRFSGLHVYFAHVLTSVLIYNLSIFIASCTDITTTKMMLSCAIVLVRAATCLVGASFWCSQFL